MKHEVIGKKGILRTADLRATVETTVIEVRREQFGETWSFVEPRIKEFANARFERFRRKLNEAVKPGAKLTEDEHKYFSEIYGEIDANKDGVLEVRELRMMMQRFTFFVFFRYLI